MKDYNAIIHNMREEHHVNFEQLRNIIYRLENKILAAERRIKDLENTAAEQRQTNKNNEYWIGCLQAECKNCD